jgi:hypothetical protein
VAGVLRYLRPHPIVRLRRTLGLLLLLSLAACGGGGPTAPRPAPAPSVPPYNRDEWPHWIDADGDCQNTRAEVLIRDSRVPVTFRAEPDGRPCVVVKGEWLDPYTARVFTDPSALDIDHVVPLANAHASGGWAWSPERKRDYANDLSDPLHLLPVSASANRDKGASGPERWLPPNRAFGCTYGRAWQRIKARWELSMTPAEREAVERLIAGCG